MDIDPIELKDQAEEAHASKSALNAMVAVTIAIIATFMGLCKVKDDNIVQAMQQAQAKSVDQWNYYQARNTQAKSAANTSDLMKLASLADQGAAKEFAKQKADFYAAETKRLTEEKEKVKTEAEAQEKLYDSLNYRDDQFDLADALMAISISMLAVTSLTQKRFLFWIAMVPTVLGIFMGLAGLLAWKVHPDVITNLLSVIHSMIR